MLNTAKQTMLEGRPAIGALAGLGSPLAAEYLSRAGFDFVLVDVQHGSWDLTPAKDAFRAISLGAAIPMARAAQNDFYAIGSLLDRGALGIVVPMLNSADEARPAFGTQVDKPEVVCYLYSIGGRRRRRPGPTVAGFYSWTGWPATGGVGVARGMRTTSTRAEGSQCRPVNTNCPKCPFPIRSSPIRNSSSTLPSPALCPRAR